jgi:hypothetical protein
MFSPQNKKGLETFERWKRENGGKDFSVAK